jgi:hypothetical protein
MKVTIHSDFHVEIEHANGVVTLEYDTAADYVEACRDSPECAAKYTLYALQMEGAEVAIPDFLTVDDEGVHWMPVWLAHEVLQMTDEPNWCHWAELVIEDAETFAA